jgi:hypothetical protein
MWLRARLEFKLADMWIGVFWKRSPFWLNTGLPRHIRTDVWVCVLPCFPLHIWWDKKETI